MTWVDPASRGFEVHGSRIVVTGHPHIDALLRALKKCVQYEGIYADVRRHEQFESAGARRRRKSAAARRRNAL